METSHLRGTRLSAPRACSAWPVQSRYAVFGRTGRNDLCNVHRVASDVEWGLSTPGVEILFFCCAMDGGDAEMAENSKLPNRIVTMFDIIAGQLALDRSEKPAPLPGKK